MAGKMTVRNPQHRVGMFVDVQNLFYAAKLLHQSKVDYGKLIREVSGGRQVVKAVAYIVQRPDVDNRSFCDALAKMGYELRSKALKIRSDNSARGNWNVGLALEAIQLASRLDVVALVSGDGDFEPLARAVRGMGCLFEVFSFERSVSQDLVDAADAFLPITESVLFKEKKFERSAYDSRWQPFGPLGPVENQAAEKGPEVAPKPAAPTENTGT